MNWLPPAVFGLVVALSLSGCDTDVEKTSPIATVEGAIYGGDGPDQAHHHATVALATRSGNTVIPEAWCSGTLVAPDVVVTAAHCLDVARGGKQYQTIAPSQVAVYFGDDIQSDPSGVFVGVSETLIFSSYDRRALSDDLALIRLSSPVAGVTVPSLPGALGLSQDDVNASTSLEFAGFGRTEAGYTDELLHADGLVGGLGCTVAGCYGADDPATQFSYLQPSGGPCFGDSGGPAYIQRGGAWYLAGVTSWGGDSCAGPNAFGVSTRVDAYEGWIAAFAGPAGPDCSANGACNAACAAGVDPDCEPAGPDCSADGVCNDTCAAGDDPDCEPAGPDCSADGVCNDNCAAGDDPDCEPASSCGDGVCGDGESCDGRDGTERCSDCQGRLKGKKATRFCEVEGVCVGPGC